MTTNKETKEKKDNVKFWMQVVVLPILVMLIGSEGWQYYAAPGKIQSDTEKHSKVQFQVNYDSLRTVVANEAFVKGVFSGGVQKYKQLEGDEMDRYLFNVFKLADKGLKNDSIWSNEQLPFIKWLIANRTFLDHLFRYQHLVPMRDRETNNLEFNWIDGIYPITERRSSNGSIIRRWRDRSDDLHPIQSISNIQDQ